MTRPLLFFQMLSTMFKTIEIHKFTKGDRVSHLVACVFRRSKGIWGMRLSVT